MTSARRDDVDFLSVARGLTAYFEVQDQSRDEWAAGRAAAAAWLDLLQQPRVSPGEARSLARRLAGAGAYHSSGWTELRLMAGLWAAGLSGAPGHGR